MSKDVKKESIMDLIDGRRKFEFVKEDGNTDDYYIGTPNAQDVRDADWEHAKRYNQALKEGIFTVSEMMEILKKRNIIGSKYDQTGEDLRVDLAEKVVEMERETDREERMKLAIQVAELREEVFQWNQRLSSPLASTCENLANDSRVEFITGAVIQVVDGSRLWSTFDDYKAEKNLALQTKSRFEVMLWLEGVESDFLEKAPENVVMKELMNAEDLEASAPDAELVQQVKESEEAEKTEEVEEAGETVAEVVRATEVAEVSEEKKKAPVSRGTRKKRVSRKKKAAKKSE